jgi:crotonobetainyl-CoA:carnitine CoA-transferase CaiB-like acyl-CoA transferase
MGGGIMHVTGEPDGPPTSVGLPICDLGTGMWAVQGVLAAPLRARAHRQGTPRRILATGDRDQLQFVDLGAMARRPRGADPPRLAPSLERALPAHADKERLSDGGGG